MVLLQSYASRRGRVPRTSSYGTAAAVVRVSTHHGGNAPRRPGIPKDKMDRIYLATAEATEEAIVNALVAAETMQGINGNTYYALPHDRLREILKKYNKLEK